MKSALIAALCAGAMIPFWPSGAQARPREAPPQPLGAVTFKKLPEAAQEALERLRRQGRASPYRCYGLSEKAYRRALGVLVPTDYNGDGQLDYIFNSPCRVPDPARERPSSAILLSGPLGYEIGRRFDATLGVVNGQATLLFEAPCESGSPEEAEGATCYVGRMWDARIGRWRGAQRFHLAWDATQFIVGPLYRPVAAAPPPDPVEAAPPPVLLSPASLAAPIVLKPLAPPMQPPIEPMSDAPKAKSAAKSPRG